MTGMYTDTHTKALSALATRSHYHSALIPDDNPLQPRTDRDYAF